jgi:HlyD family secretion protein
VWLALGGVGILLLLFFLLRGGNGRQGYVFGKVAKATITEIVSESGTIVPDGSVTVYSPTNGLVTEIYVSNGQRVKAGDKLFKVVSSATDAEKRAAYADYLAAKAAADADLADQYSLQSTLFSAWKRYMDLATNATYQNSDGSAHTEHRLAPEFTTALATWRAAEVAYQNQKSVIAKDQAALAAANALYRATQTTVVTAPLAGTVVNLAPSIGNSVLARTALTPTPQPVLLVKNSDALEAVLAVSQTHIAKIKIGQTVAIKPDAYKEKKYMGTVIRLDNIGTNVQGVVTFNVYATVAADDYLKSGMTFDGDITTQQAEAALVVPNSAVVTDQGKPVVRVLQAGSLRNVPVTIGIKGKTQTQILSGLTEGQEIVVTLTNQRAQRPGFMGL